MALNSTNIIAEYMGFGLQNRKYSVLNRKFLKCFKLRKKTTSSHTAIRSQEDF